MPRTTPPKKPRKPTVKLPTDDKNVWRVVLAKNGNVSQAAQHLKVHHETLRAWMRQGERQKRLDEIRAGADDSIIDQALTALERNLKSRDGRVSNAASRTAFQFMGKRRGYVPASYVEQKNLDDVTVRVVRDDIKEKPDD